MSFEALAWQSTASFSALTRNHAATATAAVSAAAGIQSDAAEGISTAKAAAAADKYVLLCTGGLEDVAAELVRNFLGPSEISVEAMQRQVRIAVALCAHYWNQLAHSPSIHTVLTALQHAA
jgi:hypothetical protein